MRASRPSAIHALYGVREARLDPHSDQSRVACRDVAAFRIRRRFSDRPGLHDLAGTVDGQDHPYLMDGFASRHVAMRKLQERWLRIDQQPFDVDEPIRARKGRRRSAADECASVPAGRSCLSLFNQRFERDTRRDQLVDLDIGVARARKQRASLGALLWRARRERCRRAVEPGCARRLHQTVRVAAAVPGLLGSALAGEIGRFRSRSNAHALTTFKQSTSVWVRHASSR